MVKRYYIDLESAQYGGNFKQFDLMIEDADGEFVTHSDYAALLARAEAAESELARVKASGIEAMRRAEAAEKERDRYKDVLEQIVRDYLPNLPFVEKARSALSNVIEIEKEHIVAAMIFSASVGATPDETSDIARAYGVQE